MTDSQPEQHSPMNDALARALERERRARTEAERLLESKSADLYAANERLAALAASLAARERYVTAVLEAAQEGILVLDSTGSIESANPAASALLDTPIGDLVGMSAATILELDGVAHRTAADLITALGRKALHEGSVATDDGGTLPVRIAVGQLHDVEVSSDPRYILVLHDLTEERLATEALRLTAFQDLLTGLANRAALVDTFHQHEHQDSAVIAIDLQRFRRINDSLGRSVGDDVLRIMAERLVNAAPSAGTSLPVVDRWTIGRIGPDEFAVVIQGSFDDDDLSGIVEHVRVLAEEPITVKGFSIPLEVCVGYSRVAATLEVDDARVFESGLDRAVIALEHTRRRIGSRVSAYRSDMGAERARVLAVEDRIRQGLERGEFVAYFQPRVDIATGDIVAGEALARWENSERGLLLPAAFLPIAEQSSLIIAIGEAMFDHVLRMQTVCATDAVARPISINLSNHEFALPSVVDRMERMAHDAGVPTYLVEVEIQESVIMEDLDYSSSVLNRFKERGFVVALDDFGTGHSSLGRLRSLPIDVLKLDRSFVSAVPGDQQSTEILTAMVRLAEAVGATVVVEGVESESQLLVVREAGDCEVQGFFFSPAVSPDRYLELLVTQPWRPRP